MSTPPSAGPRGARRRRRGRRRSRPAEPPPLVPEVSRLTTAAPAATAMDAAEVAEMREHLAFLRRYKEALRLKLNAVEDLLVNGQRQPTDRGVCRHLLAKVDRAVIEQALAREPLRSDATARARMLAGAIRFTADIGILLAYLETLGHVRSHAEAAQAFAEVVARIDFESVAPGRLARLLQVLVATFTDHERVQVLFNLLAIPAFRRAFDAGLASFPPDVVDACAPLRAVHRRLLEGNGEAAPTDLLVRGLELVLAAPDAILRRYPEALRAGMITLAFDRDAPAAVADRATTALLPTLPRDGRTYARLAIGRAAQLLSQHADDRARALLQELLRAQPGARPADRWLAALGARRLGRVALTGDPPARGRLIPGLWLDGQRPVWLRTAASADAARVAEEARLQTEAAVAGVAPVVEHGVGHGIPYVAVIAAGQVLDATAERSPTVALGLTASALRVLRALALAGVALPDAAAERFVSAGAGPPALVLADLDGARAVEPAAAEAAHLVAAVALAKALVSEAIRERLTPSARAAIARVIAAPASFPDLIAVLDRSALTATADGR